MGTTRPIAACDFVLETVVVVVVFSFNNQCCQTQQIHMLNKSSAVAEMGDRLVTIDMGRKVGAVVPLSVGGELGPHLTQCGLDRGLSPYQVASCRIHPTVWPQLANVRAYRQDTGQTDRQRTDSIRRTVLQMVAQNEI